MGLTFLLSFEIEFETDSEDASNNFVGAFVNLYLATAGTGSFRAKFSKDGYKHFKGAFCGIQKMQIINFWAEVGA